MAALEVLPQTELECDLQRLGDMITRNAVEEARRYVRELTEKWPDSEAVHNYARVLAPPKVLQVGGPHPLEHLKRERAWLQQHRLDYAGQLIAVRGDKVIFATKDGHEMRRFLDTYPHRDKVLLASQ